MHRTQMLSRQRYGAHSVSGSVSLLLLSTFRGKQVHDLTISGWRAIPSAGASAHRAKSGRLWNSESLFFTPEVVKFFKPVVGSHEFKVLVIKAVFATQTQFSLVVSNNVEWMRIENLWQSVNGRGKLKWKSRWIWTWQNTTLADSFISELTYLFIYLIWNSYKSTHEC